jgi:hypothetical protein
MLKSTVERLDELVRLPRNPKLHDLQKINVSYEEFGFLQRVIINDTTGRLIAGHGRIDTLQRRKAAGPIKDKKYVPDNIEVADDGMWLVPADHVDVPEAREEAAALALNRLGEGDYDEAMLASVLSDLAAQGKIDGRDGLAGTGFDADDLDALLAFTSMTGLEATPDVDTQWKPPIPSWRIIVQGDDEKQIREIADLIGIEYDPKRVRYNYEETALGKDE